MAAATAPVSRARLRNSLVRAFLPRLEISKEELAQLPIRSFRGHIHAVSTSQDEDKAFEILRNEQLLGFDTESRVHFSRAANNSKVATVQVSSASSVVIYHLSQLGYFPKSLKHLLESKDVFKVGQSLVGDASLLRQDFGVHLNSFLCLHMLGKGLGCSPLSLQGLTALFLGMRISKAETMSNWEGFPLTPQQMRYAATDAWVSRQVYVRMASCVPELTGLPCHTVMHTAAGGAGGGGAGGATTPSSGVVLGGDSGSGSNSGSQVSASSSSRKGERRRAQLARLDPASPTAPQPVTVQQLHEWCVLSGMPLPLYFYAEAEERSEKGNTQHQCTMHLRPPPLVATGAAAADPATTLVVKGAPATSKGAARLHAVARMQLEMKAQRQQAQQQAQAAQLEDDE